MFLGPKIELNTHAKWADFILKGILLVIIIPLFVPFSPKMPAPGLDPSWALALNQAVAQGLIFGKQIIFTLGPYSSIYTKAYHPATDLMMIVGSSYLALSYWVCVVLIAKGTHWRWTLVLGLFFLVMIYAKDALFFSYPLLAGILTLKLTHQNSALRLVKGALLLPVLIFAPFGLLCLIKGSLLILCLMMTFLCTGFFIVHKKTGQGLLCFLSPLVAILLFWHAAGQSIIYLPQYIIHSIALAQAFTETMSTSGNNNEVIVYLLGCTTILYLVATQKTIRASSKLFLICIWGLFLFLSFKAGFARHLGHAFIPGTAILMAALLLPFLFNAKLLIPVILVSVGTSFYIDSQYTRISPVNNLRSTYASAWYGFLSRIQKEDWLKQNFKVTMNYLRDQSQFPELAGSSDVYSYDQTYLIASNTVWSPRPIFQSYSVFTKQLADKNKQHLLSNNRPDNILFNMSPIDGRMPSLEDGSSWPALMDYYQPSHFVKDYLLLQKINPIKLPIKPMMDLGQETHYLGELVVIPDVDKQLFVAIQLKPTILGRVANLLFKSHQLQVTLELKDGVKKHYRLSANMAKSVFLLSPLIESTKEFAMLYREKNELSNKKVQSFVITTNPTKSWQWGSSYTIDFKSRSRALA